MNYKNVFILFVVSLQICQNPLASSNKDGSKIDKNVENPKEFNEKSSEAQVSSVKESSKIEKNVKNPTEFNEKSTESLPSLVKEATNIEENVENPTKFNEKSTESPLKGHLLFFHNQGTRSHLIVMSALGKSINYVDRFWPPPPPFVDKNLLNRL